MNTFKINHLVDCTVDQERYIIAKKSPHQEETLN